MLKISQAPADGVVLADVEQALTRDDQVTLRELLADTIGEYRRAKVMLGLHGFDYTEQDATDIWLDVKPAAFIKGMTRLAVVTEPEHVEDFKRFTFMAPCPTKIFPVERRAEAIAWLVG